jgi:hypothetical protein
LVRVFLQKFTFEDAIGSHACSEANMRVTNGIHLGCSLLLSVDTVNYVQTLKAKLHRHHHRWERMESFHMRSSRRRVRRHSHCRCRRADASSAGRGLAGRETKGRPIKRTSTTSTNSSIASGCILLGSGLSQAAPVLGSPSTVSRHVSSGWIKRAAAATAPFSSQRCPEHILLLLQLDQQYGARFSTGICTSRMPLSFTPLLRLKRCHTCDQWHSSRVSTPLTGSHCKLRPTTEGRSDVGGPNCNDPVLNKGTVLVFDRNLHSRMPLSFTPLLRLKRASM